MRGGIGRLAFDSVTPRERKLFQELVREKAGLRFTGEEAADVDKALLTRARAVGAGSIMAYYYRVTSHPGSAGELGKLIELMTVGETYFFRHPAHFRALGQHILPELARSGRARAACVGAITSLVPSMRIWSAGCASGEEPFSIAMVAREKLPDFPSWDIRIIGTDIHEEALEVARQGRYRKRSVRSDFEGCLARYLRREGDVYVLSETIRKMVEFQYRNLADLSAGLCLPDMPRTDLIYCRNVLMYFEPGLAERILEGFFECLSPGGYLVLGAAESIKDRSIGFESVKLGHTFFYRRPAEAARQ